MRQIYNIVALLALLHLAVLVGLGVFLTTTGRIDAERIEKIAAIMRGDDVQIGRDANAARATSQPAAIPVVAKITSEKIAEAQTTDELKELIGERLLREAADRKALVDAAMLKATQQMEELARQRSEFEETRKLAKQADEALAREFELEVLSKLSEKNARDLLMKRPMPDVIRILMTMKRRSAAAILEACKSDAEKAWATQVFQEIATQDEGLAKALAKSTP